MSCLGASVLPLVVPSVASGRVAAVLIAFCVGGRAAYCVRVGGWSVVRLPLVCASGVLSGLHPPPFLLSVLVFGVPILCTRFSICDRKENEKSKRNGKQFIIEFYHFHVSGKEKVIAL